MMIAFIDDHRRAYGIEPICRVLRPSRMTYETEDNFEGFDTSRILLINPDGTAAEYEVKIWIR